MLNEILTFTGFWDLSLLLSVVANIVNSSESKNAKMVLKLQLYRGIKMLAFHFTPTTGKLWN